MWRQHGEEEEAKHASAIFGGRAGESGNLRCQSEVTQLDDVNGSLLLYGMSAINLMLKLRSGSNVQTKPRRGKKQREELEGEPVSVFLPTILPVAGP